MPLQFDVSDNSDENMAIRGRYGAVTLPAVVFLDTNGNVLGRVTDLVEPEELLEIIRPAARALRASTDQAKTP